MTEPARAANATGLPPHPLPRCAGRVRRLGQERTRAVVEWLVWVAVVAAVYVFVPVAA